MARRRNYAAERQRRDELARSRGFAGYSAQRRAPRRLTGIADFARLTPQARDSRSDALRVIGRARSERVTVESAAGQLGVPMSTVRFWAGDALEPTRRGRTHTTEGDRLTRLRPVLLDGEPEARFVVVRGSRAAARADEVFDVQWRFITGRADVSELDQIRGVRIAGKAVESDPDRLELLANQGAFTLEEHYRELVG